MLHREYLTCLFVLLDIRLEPQAIDLQFLNWAVEKQIPIVLVFTKADKLSKNKVYGSVERYKSILLNDWEYLPDIFITSTVDQRGKDDIINFLASINSV